MPEAGTGESVDEGKEVRPESKVRQREWHHGPVQERRARNSFPRL